MSKTSNNNGIIWGRSTCIDTYCLGKLEGILTIALSFLLLPVLDASLMATEIIEREVYYSVKINFHHNWESKL